MSRCWKWGRNTGLAFRAVIEGIGGALFMFMMVYGLLAFAEWILGFTGD